MEHPTTLHPWATLEDLLLACAVSKHGKDRWDSVSTELRTRTSLAGISTENFRTRYSDLQRRFSSPDDESTCLVKKLTEIRVADLRRDLRERDASIASLESKVKRLKEESQREAKTERDSGAESPRQRVKSKSNPSDSNRSFNESNSTEDQNNRDSARNRGKQRNAEKSETRAKTKPEANREEETEEEAKQSSEVQSSSKRRRIAGAGEEESPAMATTKLSSDIKSEPLVEMLKTVRSHRLGAVFQRRLRSQESQRYKNMVRQHMDLRTVEARLEKGVYSNHPRKFFRDLLLIFSNAVVFFPPASDEHVAATELRSTVLNAIRRTMPNTDFTIIKKLGSKSKPLTALKSEEPKREVKHETCKTKSSVLATCHNKSNASKAVSEGPNKKGINGIKKDKDLKVNGNKKVNGSSYLEKVQVVVKRKSTQVEVKRGSNNSGDDSCEHGFGGNERSSHDAATKTKKKKGVVSFLKRIKQNSPVKPEEEGSDDDDVSNEDHHNESGDVASISEEEKEDEDEEDRVKVESSDVSKKKKGTPASKSPEFKSPARKDNKRLTRNAAAKEESSQMGKRGVGRPPKRPEKAHANGKKSSSDRQREAGKAKKRSRK